VRCQRKKTVGGGWDDNGNQELEDGSRVRPPTNPKSMGVQICQSGRNSIFIHQKLWESFTYNCTYPRNIIVHIPGTKKLGKPQIIRKS
jgi:hypothetical protein